MNSIVHRDTTLVRAVPPPPPTYYVSRADLLCSPAAVSYMNTGNLPNGLDMISTGTGCFLPSKYVAQHSVHALCSCNPPIETPYICRISNVGCLLP